MTSSTPPSASPSYLSGSPASSLVSSPPAPFLQRRTSASGIHQNDYDLPDDAIISSSELGGTRFGPIGSGIPMQSYYPKELVHEILLYDDEDDEVVVYNPRK
jgi:hypothetical protein